MDLLNQELLTKLTAKIQGSSVTLVQETGNPGVARIRMPQHDKGMRDLAIFDDNLLQTLVDSDLINMKILNGYEAVVNWPKQQIEAKLEVLANRGSGWWRLSDDNATGLTLGPPDAIDLGFDTSSGIHVKIANSSSFASQFLFPRHTHFSLFLENIPGEMEPIGLLVDISNSLFFQIEIGREVSLALVKSKRLVSDFEMPTLNLEELGYNDFKYDRKAMLHYWQAQSSADIPFVRFLSFYQVVEYFFPVFQYKDAVSRASLILKDPAFPRNDDLRVSKLVQELFKLKSETGKERAVLKTTIRACVNANQLKRMIVSDAEMNKFFAKGGEYNALSDKQPNLSGSEEEFLSTISDRIYDIRCDIVHSKEQSEDIADTHGYKFIEDSALLRYDLKIMKFIARSILIANSSFF